MGCGTYTCDHSHDSYDASNIYHDDSHSGDFHLHPGQLPAEELAPRIVFFETIILGYFGVVFIHFVLFALCKPKINNSRREKRCMRIKYLMCWFVLTVLVIGL